MTTTVRLSKPILVANDEVWDLSFREPTIGDIVRFDGSSGAAKLLKMIEVLAGITPREAASINARDLPRIVEAIQGFFSASPPAGRSS